MDVALQYLEGVEIRINTYFREFMTLNISRNILILQICVPEQEPTLIMG